VHVLTDSRVICAVSCYSMVDVLTVFEPCTYSANYFLVQYPFGTCKSYLQRLDPVRMRTAVTLFISKFVSFF